MYSLALATLVPLVAAHGFINSPSPRLPGDAFAAACGQQPFSQQSSDINGNVQGILQVVGDDLDPAACNLWLCKGFQFDDNVDNVQSFSLGETIDFDINIAAPHTGFANVSVVKTSTDTIIGAPLIEFDNYASNGGLAANNTAFSVTLPDDLGGDCTTPGDCVLQWFWDAPDIDQTYESCVDFTVSGGSGSNPPPPAETTEPDTPEPSTTVPAPQPTSTVPAEDDEEDDEEPIPGCPEEDEDEEDDEELPEDDEEEIPGCEEEEEEEEDDEEEEEVDDCDLEGVGDDDEEEDGEVEEPIDDDDELPVEDEEPVDDCEEVGEDDELPEEDEEEEPIDDGCPEEDEEDEDDDEPIDDGCPEEDEDEDDEIPEEDDEEEPIDDGCPEDDYDEDEDDIDEELPTPDLPPGAPTPIIVPIAAATA